MVGTPAYTPSKHAVSGLREIDLGVDQVDAYEVVDIGCRHDETDGSGLCAASDSCELRCAGVY
jgi:hypothetical protein